MKKGKKTAKPKKMAAPSGMMDAFKVKPVSIHLHATGAHLKEAQADLAAQLKPLGFTQKKAGMARGSRKSIAEALSS